MINSNILSCQIEFKLLAIAADSAEIVICRAEFDLPGAFWDKEKAFIVQLDAAASMMSLGMRGLLVINKKEAKFFQATSFVAP